MATIILKNPGTPAFGGTPYGNNLVRHYVLQTLANGAAVGSNSVAAIGINDKVVLGHLPKGTRLDDALAIIMDAFSATTTFNLGFEYQDGVEDTQAAADKEGRPLVLQDPDYFFTAGALAAQARLRANNVTVEPVTLPKDANLILTNLVAAQAVVGKAHFLIYGEDRGPL